MSVDLSSLGVIKFKTANDKTLSLAAPTTLESNLTKVIGRKNVIPVAADVTLTPAQSGSVIAVSKAAPYDITLPDPAEGLEFDFVQSTIAAGNAVRIDAGAGLLFGSWINTVAGTLTGATTAGTGVRYYSFLAASVKGDNVKLVSDGTNWYARGMIGVAAGASFS